MTKDEEKELADRYMRGATIKELEARFAICYKSVRQALERHLGKGAPHRNRNRAFARREAPHHRTLGGQGLYAAALLASEPNLSLAEVARRAGLTRERVGQIFAKLEKAGFPVASAKERRDGAKRVREASGLLVRVLAGDGIRERIGWHDHNALKRALSLLTEGGES